MRALEINSEYYGVSRLQLMENAGKNVSDQIATRFKPTKTKVALFCGLGGNGGDGFVAARHLLSHGFSVEVVLAGKRNEISNKEAKTNLNALKKLKGYLVINEVYDSSLIPNIKADVVVDALLGIGLKGTPRPPIRQLVAKINKTEAFCIAVDVPTGINSDSGEVLGEVVEADLTITFHKPKPGLAMAKEYTGEIVVGNIGLPRQIELFSGPGDIEIIHKPRSPEAHKGDFGRLLVIGGSEVFSGAAALVASAAHRTGVDLVYIAAPIRTAYAISSMSPDLITVKLEGDHINPRNLAQLEAYLEKSTAVAMGPGMGLHKETKEFVRELVQKVATRRMPLLLDADGLKAFADFKHEAKSPIVLTPHASEYKILTGNEAPRELEERAADVQKSAETLNAVILLKGHTDVISDGKRVKFNFTGNPGMTVGGTGDVLSGIIAGLLAQNIDPFEAAVAGAFINGAAGDDVASEKGFHMIATDLLDRIPGVLNAPRSHSKVQKLG